MLLTECPLCEWLALTLRRSCATCRSIARTTPTKTELISPRWISGPGQEMEITKPELARTSNEQSSSHCLSGPSWRNRVEHFRTTHRLDGLALNRARRA